ncbi:NADH-cytochrome b5 reductase 2 [Venturia nashicola]|uniref:NADH-cytochrome b5 reductase 2 n=1 Tax=Venturia nashicola TaxID=86259 RepID=A0A4Z1PDV4_9PEZI|nr:NADH-cytochrome b5 reductase 2 [Venturia nashicola]
MIISTFSFQTLCLITSLAKLIHAQDDRPRDASNSFSYPWTAEKLGPGTFGRNPVHALGSQITIVWSTNYKSYGIDLLRDGTDQSWSVAAITAKTRQLTWVAKAPAGHPDPIKKGVYYFAITSWDGGTSWDGRYFYSHYFNLTGELKSTSGPSSTSGSSSGTSMIVVTHSMTTNSPRSVVATVPSSSSSPLSPSAFLTRSIQPILFSGSKDAVSVKHTSTSAFASDLVSTTISNPNTIPKTSATSSPTPSTAERDTMAIYGGAIGGGIGCAALISVVAYFVMRYRSKKRLTREILSSGTRPELHERKPGCRCASSTPGTYQMDSPTLPAITRPDTSTSIGTSILFPEYSADEGAWSIGYFSD